jgi:ferredoxin
MKIEGSLMGKRVARIDRDKCQGFAACVRFEPRIFSMGLDQIAEVEPSETVDDEILEGAAKRCPFKAILLVDAD